MPTNNAILDGLQSFNQSLGELAQQRALTDASQKVRQIQQSELNDNQKQQALQQFGQQFALHATAVGMDPSQAFGIAQHIGPARPLIQSAIQGATYGTPEEQLRIQESEQRAQSRALELKHDEDEYQLKRQDKLLASQEKRASEANGTKLLQIQANTQKANQAAVEKTGHDFRTDKLLNRHAELQTQYQAFDKLLSSPNALNAATASDVYHQFVESTASREADIARVQGAQGIMNSIETTFNKYKGTDKVLPPETVAALRSSARTLSSKLTEAATKKRQQYRMGIAQKGGDYNLYDPLNFLDQPSQGNSPPTGSIPGAQPQGFIQNWPFTK